MSTPLETSRTTREPSATAPALHLPPAELLAAQPPGRPCVLVGLSAGGKLGQRLADMGFAPGLALRVVRRAPLGDPMEVDLSGARVCIRTSEAAMVLVRPLAPQREERP